MTGRAGVAQASRRGWLQPERERGEAGREGSLRSAARSFIHHLYWDHVPNLSSPAQKLTGVFV